MCGAVALYPTSCLQATSKKPKPRQLRSLAFPALRPKPNSSLAINPASPSAAFRASAYAWHSPVPASHCLQAWQFSTLVGKPFLSVSQLWHCPVDTLLDQQLPDAPPEQAPLQTWKPVGAEMRQTRAAEAAEAKMRRARRGKVARILRGVCRTRGGVVR